MSEPTPDTDATPEEPGGEQPEAFTNRAARRAKGKKSAKPEVFAKGKQPDRPRRGAEPPAVRHPPHRLTARVVSPG